MKSCTKLLPSVTQFSRNFFAPLVLLTASLLIAPHSLASVYVAPDDDVYDVLNYLEAEGIIQSSLLTTKPLSRKEIARLILEAESNSEGKSLSVQQVINSLKKRFKNEFDRKKYIKPVDDIFVQYIYSDSIHSEKLTYNNDGDRYEKGSQYRFNFSTRTDLGWLSLSFNPEIRYSDSDTDLVMNRAYGVLNLSGLEIELGKDSQWWGPGYHGTILLSNNSEPFTILKFSNSQPVILPSLFRHLGLFKFTLFAARLEKEREVPNPYLWGMRMNIKPNPYIEIGLQRTALLGGKGRSENLKTWLKSLTSAGESASPGELTDQRAGVDVKLTIPFRWQPIQWYAEAAGEDKSADKVAYLTGVYLPGILGIDRLYFRAEFANTHVSGNPSAWYNNAIYLSGYTYKGRIIGHHIGTDARDLYLEAGYILPKIKSGRLSLSYDKEWQNISGNIKETSEVFALTIHVPVYKALTLKTFYSHGRINNLDTIQGADKNINFIRTEISYQF